MKLTWITAALFSSAIVVGCGGREAENSADLEGNEGTSVAIAPEADEQAMLVAPPREQGALSPDADSSTGAANTGGSQATAGTRAQRPAPAAAPRRQRVETEASRPAVTAPRPRVAAAPAAPRVRVVTIPAGTALPLELTTALSTETARVEMPVTARLSRSVRVDGETVFPAGAVVNGEVIEVGRPGRVQGRARLGLRFTSVTVDGRREDIRTNPVMFEGEATKGEDATKIGAGAGIGAAIGGLLGGGDGAAKGAAIGGAAGTGAVLATRGRDVELTAGQDIDASLASAVDIEVR